MDYQDPEKQLIDCFYLPINDSFQSIDSLNITITSDVSMPLQPYKQEVRPKSREEPRLDDFKAALEIQANEKEELISRIEEIVKVHSPADSLSKVLDLEQ